MPRDSHDDQADAQIREVASTPERVDTGAVQFPAPVAPVAAKPVKHSRVADASAEPEFHDLNPAQQQVLLDMTLHCLTQIAGLEQLMGEKGLADSEEFSVLSEARLELTHEVQQARATWREEQQQQQADVAAEAPEASAAYQAIPPFTHTLGPMEGAVNEGQEVINLQKLLNLEGLELPLSGHYDRPTSQAVGKLQAKYNLQQRNGIVGRETRQLLNRLTGHGK